MTINGNSTWLPTMWVSLSLHHGEWQYWPIIEPAQFHFLSVFHLFHSQRSSPPHFPVFFRLPEYWRPNLLSAIEKSEKLTTQWLCWILLRRSTCLAFRQCCDAEIQPTRIVNYHSRILYISLSVVAWLGVIGCLLKWTNCITSGFENWKVSVGKFGLMSRENFFEAFSTTVTCSGALARSSSMSGAPLKRACT